jgi:hypothetical protein
VYGRPTSTRPARTETQAGSEKEIARGERAGAAPGCDLGDSLTQQIFDRREVVRVCAAEIIFVVCDQHYDAV